MSNTLERLKRGDLHLDFNWNSEKDVQSQLIGKIHPEPNAKDAIKTVIVAEDARDGFHGIETYPPPDTTLNYIGALRELGIDQMTVGIYPGEGNKIDKSIKSILAGMRDQYPELTPIVLSMATEESINWTADCKQINPNLNAIVFMGTAPSRLLVEEWEENFILKTLGWAVEETTAKHQIDVIGATEHTTQTPPDFLRKIVQAQVNSGAKFFCIADTIGIARPIGAYRIVRFVKEILNDMDAHDILIDWHGHRDMGNDIGNAMAAISAGANRIHTVARGIGERAGNTQMEAVLVNLTQIIEESGMQSPWRMEQLASVLDLYSNIVRNPIPTHGPLAARSHTTSLGIHTAAMFKAEKLAREARDGRDEELAIKLEQMARNIYSAIDPLTVGKEHNITVSPWSGASTVKLAYLARGGDPDKLNQKTISSVLQFAKQLGRQLTSVELDKLFENH